MRDDKLLDYLKSSCHGRENRKSGRELARTLGINVKDLQKLVKRLRKKKNPIASDQYGYYYAATAAELCDSMDFLQGMADGLMEDIRSMRGCLDGYSERDGAAKVGHSAPSFRKIWATRWSLLLTHTPRL